MAPSITREAAVALASLGVPVFPLVWRSKEPLPRSRGLYDASADLVLTRRRWAGRLYNVAVRTGLNIGSGFLNVFDVDGETGYRSLDDLERQHGRLPETFTVATSRGEHRYFSGPPLPSRTGFFPGLDWKGIGGYVVGPCSVHPSGAVYRCRDWNAPIAAAPDWLTDHVKHRPVVTQTPEAEREVRDGDRYLDAAIAGEAHRLKNVSIDRNTSLFYAACRLRKLMDATAPKNRGAIEADIAKTLLKSAEHIGLPTTEARKTIASGLGEAKGGRHAS